MPPLLLLALVGGVFVAAASQKRRRPQAGPVWTGPPERVAIPQGEQAGALVLRAFAEGGAGEYPAPYRYADAHRIAGLVLDAANETAPAWRHVFGELVRRRAAIDHAPIPPWRRTYALIMTVVLPAMGAKLFWHWLRPRSESRDAQLAAVAAWAALFFVLPVGAASGTIDPSAPFSSLLPSFEAYLDPSAQVRTELSPAEQRRALTDVFHFVASDPSWGGDHDPRKTPELVAEALARLHAIELSYPTDDAARTAEGNVALVQALVWLVASANLESVQINFDEGAAIAALVIQVVAAVVSAIVPFVAPAVGVAVTVAGAAIAAVARAAANGEISPAQIQALGGAGAALLLDQAAISLGLENELAIVESLGETVVA